MLDRIRSIRDKTLPPVRQAKPSKSSARPNSPTPTLVDASTQQAISSGIPLDRLDSPISGESSHKGQTCSTLPSISPDSHTVSSAFTSVDAQRDSTIPVIQLVDSSVDVHSDGGNPLAQRVDKTPAPALAPTSRAGERRQVAYEAFKTMLGTLHEVSGAFPPLQLAAAGLLNVITIFEVRGLAFADIYRTSSNDNETACCEKY